MVFCLISSDEYTLSLKSVQLPGQWVVNNWTTLAISPQTHVSTTNEHLRKSIHFHSRKSWFALVWGHIPNINSLRPRQNGRLFADVIFKRIFLNENIRISTENSLTFVLKGLINNIPALILIMAWRRPVDKPLSEPMLIRSLMHICASRPQWVNTSLAKRSPQYGR